MTEIDYANTYDDADRVASRTVSVAHGNPAESATMTHEYDALGRLSSIRRQSKLSSTLDVNYDYDLHGWLKGITTNKLQEELFYADGVGTPRYNGNITSIKWKHNTSSTKEGYKFTYDNANRLTQATYGTGDAITGYEMFSESVQYDAHGNIIGITRRGRVSTSSYGPMDNLTLSYDGNRLTNVSETYADHNFSGSFEYKRDNGSQYIYNSNGSLVADRSRGIAYITYDFNNNPSRIYFINGSETRYVFSASGEKLRVAHYTAKPNITRNFGERPADLTPSQTLYKDSTDYLLGGSLVMKNGKTDRLLFEGGFALATSSSSTASTFSFRYYNQDHLGNNHEVIGMRGNAYQRMDYYPFGMPYAETGSPYNPDYQPYKYNGKELDRMHGLDNYDYGARQYNPIVARWDRMDPLCEKYYSISPYAYCANNPVMLIDPNGCYPDSLEAAMMSSLAYEANSEYTTMLNKNGWYELKSTNSKSGFKSKLFQREVGEDQYEYCLSFAGTDTNAGFAEFAKDAVTDIINFLGILTPQYLQSAIQGFSTQSIVSRNSELTYTGHSLGGGLATFASKLTGKDAIIFNPASISGAMGGIAGFISLFQGGTITQFRSRGDYVNLGQDIMHKPSSGQINWVNTGKKTSHSIKDIINAFLKR
ncbi:MAG: hypothetical protein J6X07_06910 [Prevotella sp.]|nr:hypothetical protein [Prevotella sp.]